MPRAHHRSGTLKLSATGHRDEAKAGGRQCEIEAEHRSSVAAILRRRTGAQSGGAQKSGSKTTETDPGKKTTLKSLLSFYFDLNTFSRILN